jgi:hypothetical protein
MKDTVKYMTKNKGPNLESNTEIINRALQHLGVNSQSTKSDQYVHQMDKGQQKCGI